LLCLGFFSAWTASHGCLVFSASPCSTSAICKIPHHIISCPIHSPHSLRSFLLLFCPLVCGLSLGWEWMLWCPHTQTGWVRHGSSSLWLVEWMTPHHYIEHHILNVLHLSVYLSIWTFWISLFSEK
jgi:hypothetical protein